MPHSNDTVIEMAARRRSRSPRNGDHEHPAIHRGPMERSPNRGLSPAPRHHGSHSSLHSTDASSRHNLHPNELNNGHSRTRRDVSPHSTTDTMQPLLEVVNEKPKPPMAGPEIDDLEGDGVLVATSDNHPGVDDGFFGNDDDQYGDPRLEPRFGEGDDDEGVNNSGEDAKPKPDDGVHDTDDELDGLIPANGGNYLTPPSMYSSRLSVGANGGPRYRPESPFPPMPPGNPQITPDVNVYQQKKNLAQGMMDLALLSANANQLRYILESADRHRYFYPSLVFISASLILQVAVGIGLIINSRYNVKEHDDICKADRINDMTVIGIFLITIVNVFIASFGVADSPTVASTAAISTTG